MFKRSGFSLESQRESVCLQKDPNIFSEARCSLKRHEVLPRERFATFPTAPKKETRAAVPTKVETELFFYRAIARTPLSLPRTFHRALVSVEARRRQRDKLSITTGCQDNKTEAVEGSHTSNFFPVQVKKLSGSAHYGRCFRW